MTKDEALKQALEALRMPRDYWNKTQYIKVQEAIAVTEAALAQPAPVQEPVAWMDVDEKGAISGLRYWSEPDNRHEVALYTTPPQRTWVGLTDEEIWNDDKIMGLNANTGLYMDELVGIARAIEAKLKEQK